MTTIKHADDCVEYHGHWIRAERVALSTRYAVHVDGVVLCMLGGSRRTPGTPRSFGTIKAAMAAGRKHVREDRS